MISRADVAKHLGVDDVLTTDVLVIGSGVAGLSAALAARPRSVLLATKGELASGSSPWAQGGIAAAVDPHDAPRLHAEDTERAGRGLCERDVVRLLTDAAPAAILELEALGVRFDRGPGGGHALGREGGHGQSRILHAGGDRTGAAIVEALVDAVRETPHVRVEKRLFAVDLLRLRGRVAGAVAIRETEGAPQRIALLASDVVLATGGLGQIYRYTTNPVEVTGDGIAMAARAGAKLVDLEFVQFHPTALGGDAVPEGPRPLLTEALRGAGARLVDERGARFLAQSELAPRDVVALGIYRHSASGHDVLLDLRSIEALERRFPTVVASCRAAGIEPTREPVPVTPAAHYAMGGVAVDAEGRTSVAGLWACGETASSGAHGANRLASNSLLEALVFGRRLALAIEAAPVLPVSEIAAAAHEIHAPVSHDVRKIDVGKARHQLQELMWRHVGLERAGGGLAWALASLQRWHAERDGAKISSRAEGELRNLTLVAALVSLAASRRRESRGAHVRSDYPRTRPELAHRVALRIVPGRAPLAERALFETLRSEPVLAGASP